MIPFHVMLGNSRIELTIDGRTFSGGFVRNEYVWAFSKAGAVAKAMARVARKAGALQQKGAIATAGPLELEVDEVNWPVAPWKTLRDEGFVFFEVIDNTVKPATI
jgi:hypothetical protein